MSNSTINDEKDLEIWRKHGVVDTLSDIRNESDQWSITMYKLMSPYGESTIQEIDDFASEYRDEGGMMLVEAAALMSLVPHLLGVDDEQENDRIAGVNYAIESVIKDGMNGYTYEDVMLAILGWSWHQEHLYDDYMKTTGNVETDAHFRLNSEDAGELLYAIPTAVDMISRADGLKDSAYRARGSGYPVVGPLEATSMLAVAIVCGLDPDTMPSAADISRICTLRGDPGSIPGWLDDDDDDRTWNKSMITLAMYQDMRNPELTRNALSALLNRSDPFSMDGADFDEAAMTVLKALRSLPHESLLRPDAFRSGDDGLGRYIHRITADRMSPRLVSGDMTPATAIAIIRMSSIIQRYEDALLPLINDHRITRGDSEAICSTLVDALDMDADGLPSDFVGETMMKLMGDVK